MGALILPSTGPVYLDSNVIIYSAERVAPYDNLVKPVWDAARSGQFGIVTSEITLVETLVIPIRSGDALLEAGFRALLTHSQELSMEPVSLDILETTLTIRAEKGLKMADAIHASTALRTGCTLFVTNDPIFRRVDGISVQVLSDLL